MGYEIHVSEGFGSLKHQFASVSESTVVRDLIAHATDQMEKPLEDCGNKEIVPEPPRLGTFMLDVDRGCGELRKG